MCVLYVASVIYDNEHCCKSFARTSAKGSRRFFKRIVAMNGVGETWSQVSYVSSTQVDKLVLVINVGIFKYWKFPLKCK